MAEEARALVGVDCASRDENMGVAWGHWDGAVLSLGGVERRLARAPDVLAPWIEEHDPAVVALDAPLGWPDALARHLAEHRAGRPIPEEADRLFTRETDRVVRRLTGKRPMEVGADRIARAALRAVNLLEELRHATGLPIPLGWDPGIPREPPVALEVYPATTLRARGLPDRGYKGGKGEPARRHIVEALTEGGELDPGSHADLLLLSDDALDATLCLLAAADYLEGRVVPPEDAQAERVRTEGWIWVRAEGR